MRNTLLLICLIPIIPVAQSLRKPYKGPYGINDLDKISEAPDYSNITCWIAHPDKEDMADKVPGKGQLREYQGEALADVFFVYPTVYTKKQHADHPWFADVKDEKLNKRIAKSTIKNQASVFNGSAAVYAPLYRQAHLDVFYTNEDLKNKALDFAYQDVKAAFSYYLENLNHGRPIIIASHSQGSVHATRLLKEFFEEKPLISQLIAGYIIGMPVQKDYFEVLPPCANPEQTGCWITWSTYARDYYPPNHATLYENALSVNPLTWTLDDAHVSWGANKGGVLRNFRNIRQGLSDAQNHRGMVWIDKPQFFGKFLINWDRYHILDYNLFYMNIRENVEIRVEQFLRHTK